MAGYIFLIFMKKVCKRCGKIFVKPQNVSMKIWLTQSKFCSWKCRKNPLRACLICKKKFRIGGKKRLKTAKYCSFICARKGQLNWKGGISRENNLSKFSYGQRQRIWERDKGKCQICGICNDNLIVHHKTFKKALTEDINLVLLCRVCHLKVHDMENSSIKR